MVHFNDDDNKISSDSSTTDAEVVVEETYDPSIDARGDRRIIVGPDLPPLSPTSKRLFLVRHGEVINPGGDRPVFYGSMDVPLSKLGEQEAKAAALYLSQFDLEGVFSSPLSRAMYGAERIQKYQEQPQPITIQDGFTELDRGVWAGLTKDEIGTRALARFDACDESVTPQDGESYPQLKRRVLKAHADILDQISSGSSAALVSHLQVTRCMLSEALDLPIYHMAKLKVKTASVTCIDYDSITGECTVQFQSFKPNVGLKKSRDAYN